MRKSILFTILLIAAFIIFFPKEVSAVKGTKVDGKLIIRWIDYGNLEGSRPDSIKINLRDTGDPDNTVNTANRNFDQQITINKPSDEFIKKDSNDPNITEWIIENDGVSNSLFTSETDTVNPTYTCKSVELLENYVFVEDKGTLHPAARDFTGAIYEQAGTMTITVQLDTVKPVKLNITYNDDNARDSAWPRRLRFAIKAKDVTQEEINTLNVYHEFKEINGENSISSKKDTAFGSTFVSKYKFNNEGAQNTTLEYELIETSGNTMDGLTYDFSIDDDNTNIVANAVVNYKAKTISVPIEVEWKDENNKFGKRPNSITVNAYDQKENFEKAIELSKDGMWKVNAELFENMIYSAGTPIEYIMKVENDDDYTYTVTGDNNGFKIVATYVGKNIDSSNKDSEDDNSKETPIEQDSEKDKNKPSNIQETPANESIKTGDNIIKFIAILGIAGIALSICIIKKKK